MKCTRNCIQDQNQGYIHINGNEDASWDGVWLDCPSTGPKFVVSLFFVSPVTSQLLANFVVFWASAKKGCNKCLKEFPRSSFGEKQDFSGFDRNRWNLRTHTDHKEQVWRIRNTCTSKKHVMISKVFMVCD